MYSIAGIIYILVIRTIVPVKLRYISLKCALSHVVVINLGCGPGVVVKAACLEGRRSRVRTALWPSSLKKVFLTRSLVKIQYCGEPPWPRGSGLDLWDRQGSNFESCVRREESSHHLQDRFAWPSIPWMCSRWPTTPSIHSFICGWPEQFWRHRLVYSFCASN